MWQRGDLAITGKLNTVYGIWQTGSWCQETKVNGILCHWISKIAWGMKEEKENKTGAAEDNLIM